MLPGTATPTDPPDDFEELALGDPDDYDDDAEFGLSDADASVALFFGGGSGWDDPVPTQALVVNETKGEFGPDGQSGRNDVMLMETEYDEDAEIVRAVWDAGGGRMRLETRVRRQALARHELLPYGLIAGTLLILGAVGLLGVVIVVVAAITASPRPPAVDEVPVVVVPTEEAPIIKDAKEKTADQILEEVLGDGKKK